MQHGVVLGQDRNYDHRVLRPLRFMDCGRIREHDLIEFAEQERDQAAVEVELYGGQLAARRSAG